MLILVKLLSCLWSVWTWLLEALNPASSLSLWLQICLSDHICLLSTYTLLKLRPHQSGRDFCFVQFFPLPSDFFPCMCSCVCTCMLVCGLYVYAHVCVATLTYECSCGDQRSILGIFLYNSPLYFILSPFSTEHGAFHFSRLNSQEPPSPRICLPLPLSQC